MLSTNFPNGGYLPFDYRLVQAMQVILGFTILVGTFGPYNEGKI